MLTKLMTFFRIVLAIAFCFSALHAMQPAPSTQRQTTFITFPMRKFQPELSRLPAIDPFKKIWFEAPVLGRGKKVNNIVLEMARIPAPEHKVPSNQAGTCIEPIQSLFFAFVDPQGKIQYKVMGVTLCQQKLLRCVSAQQVALQHQNQGGAYNELLEKISVWARDFETVPSRILMLPPIELQQDASLTEEQINQATAMDLIESRTEYDPTTEEIVIKAMYRPHTPLSQIFKKINIPPDIINFMVDPFIVGDVPVDPTQWRKALTQQFIWQNKIPQIVGLSLALSAMFYGGFAVFSKIYEKIAAKIEEWRISEEAKKAQKCAAAESVLLRDQPKAADLDSSSTASEIAPTGQNSIASVSAT